MRLTIISIFTLFTTLTMAETLTVQNMHCGACAKSIENVVCKKSEFKTCTVKIKNAKKQLGEITIETADGQPVNREEISKLLEEAGDYPLVSEKAAEKKKK
jgi:copper chaperone CopZ